MMNVFGFKALLSFNCRPMSIKVTKARLNVELSARISIRNTDFKVSLTVSVCQDLFNQLILHIVANVHSKQSARCDMMTGTNVISTSFSNQRDGVALASIRRGEMTNGID